MESSSSSMSSSQSHSGQIMSSKTDSSVAKGSNALSFPHSNGLSSKILDNNGSKSTMSPNKKDDASTAASSKPRDREGARTSPSPSVIKRPGFIGPILPPHMEKNRFASFQIFFNVFYRKPLMYFYTKIISFFSKTPYVIFFLRNLNNI